MPDQMSPSLTTEQIAPGIHTPAGFARATGELRGLLSGLQNAGLSDAALAAALLTEAMPRLLAVHGAQRCADLLGTLSLELRLDHAAEGPAHQRMVS